MRDPRLQLYIDTLVVETILADETMVKQAGALSGLVDTVQAYVAKHIDPNNKTASVINILSPAILWTLGFPILGSLLKVAQMFFGLDVGKIFTDAVEGVKGLITSGQKVSSEQVDASTSRAVEANAGSQMTKTQSLSEARQFKIALLDMASHLEAYNNKTLSKQAQSSMLKFLGLKSKTSSILGTIISWIIKTVLVAAGFMIAGDIANSLLGRKDTISTPSGATQVSVPKSTQTFFAVNPSYTDEKLNIEGSWIEPTPPENIGQTIIQWTQLIYPALKTANRFISDDPAFQKLVQDIQAYNSTNTTGMTFMPKMFQSRKAVVDLFIDDLANRAQALPKAQPPAKPPPLPA